MAIYHMTDIIPLLGLPDPRHAGARHYNVPCPACDSAGKKHMNINLQKDVFRCVVCDFHGGVLDLYAYYKRIPRKDANNALTQEMGSRAYYRERSEPVPREFTASSELAATDIKFRHQTYAALLNKLSLAEDHNDNLLGRGLSKDTIVKHEYRTTPVMGHRIIARQLQEAGFSLRGVPGFYKNKKGEWSLVQTGRGFFVPVRDLRGRIQGLQLRLDKADKRKYRWLSSADRPDGTGAKGWIHTAGPIRRNMILIEGGLKADIVRAYTGQSLIAIPGVNMLSELKKVLADYQTLGLETLVTAFDMDLMRNHHVSDAYTRLIEMLEGHGINWTTYVWDPLYNGLDDYCKHRFT